MIPGGGGGGGGGGGTFRYHIYIYIHIYVLNACILRYYQEGICKSSQPTSVIISSAQRIQLQLSSDLWLMMVTTKGTKDPKDLEGLAQLRDTVLEERGFAKPGCGIIT